MLMEITPVGSAAVEVVSVIGFEIAVRVCQWLWFSVYGFYPNQEPEARWRNFPWGEN
jgi:hypothetical protein